MKKLFIFMMLCSVVLGNDEKTTWKLNYLNFMNNHNDKYKKSRILEYFLFIHVSMYLSIIIFY